MKQQIVILKVKYDESEAHSPHTWNWAELVGNDHEIEVMNHGIVEEVKED